MVSEREWLDSLKPGDKVVVDGRDSFGITTVVRRTPTNRIIVKRGGGTQEFNADGSLRTSRPYDYANLQPVTQEARDRIERSNLAYQLANTEWRKLPLDKLRAHVALLGE